jgi:transcriptional regulator with XRE-family HTH domain
VDTVAFRLREVRASRGLTQRALAGKAGLRVDTISALERGKSRGISFWTLARLSDALAVEPGELFEAVDEHEVPVLGGPDEDDILRERLARRERVIDGPTFMAELLRISHRR